MSGLTSWLGHDVIDLFNLLLSQLASSTQVREHQLPFVEVDLSDLEDEVGEPSADTFDDSHSKHNLALAIDVSVLDSQNVCELVRFGQYD